jgi:hypothetical protein
MLPFGVTIPATVPQGLEIPEGLINNPVYMSVDLILNKKSYVSFSCVFDFLKKSILKLLDRTVYNKWPLFLIGSKSILLLCRILQQSEAKSFYFIVVS